MKQPRQFLRIGHRIEQDQLLHLFRVSGCIHGRDIAPQRIACQGEALEFKLINEALEGAYQKGVIHLIHVEVIRNARQTVAGHIKPDDPVVFPEAGCPVVPGVQGGHDAVEQDNDRPVGIAFIPVMNVEAVDFDKP